MSIENTKLINLLARAIQDINAPGSDALEVIDRLNCDLRDVADTSVPFLPRRKYDEVWKAPELVTLDCFYDRNEFEHAVPKGYRLRVALTTNKSWCDTYNTTTQEPNYIEVPNASGAEYVDVFFERVAQHDYDLKRAIIFEGILKDTYMLKTMNSFGPDTGVPCLMCRYTVVHEEFRAEQTMDDVI